MQDRRCNECGEEIEGARAKHPQTKYCSHCAGRRISHSTPKAVPTSNHVFESLVKARSDVLDDLRAESDALLARMQTPKARRGMKAAFNASPAELGRAAVKAAQKRR
jgi:hypothetical protein